MSQGNLLYSLDSKPKLIPALVAALQHVLASIVAIVTPTIIISSTLGLEQQMPYLICMALFMSGVSSGVQAKRIGPVGSGLLSVQGTSFAFVTALLAAGLSVKSRGASPNEILSTMFALCFVGAFVEIGLSQFLHKLKRVITPLNTGIVILTIGLSLVKVGLTDMAGGFKHPEFGAPLHLLLACCVLFTVILLNAFGGFWLRLSSILVAMLLGTGLAVFLGLYTAPDWQQTQLIAIPQPFKYGFNLDWSLFLPIALIYLLTAIETTGDLTATSLFSAQPTSGPLYLKRLKGGVLGDGVNSLVAAVFNAFPNTTFGQNNGVIQITGVASRHVGFYAAALLMLLGLFPAVGTLFQSIPKPVLGGATLVMFAMIAVGGIRILAKVPMNRRNTMIMATSLGLALGGIQVPDAFAQLPQWLSQLLAAPVVMAGISAVFLSVALPEDGANSDATSQPNVLKSPSI